MRRKSNLDQTRDILRSVNDQNRKPRMFKVTYLYSVGATVLSLASHIQASDKETVYRDFCRLRANNGLVDFRLSEDRDDMNVKAGALTAFPARSVHQIFIEEV